MPFFIFFLSECFNSKFNKSGTFFFIFLFFCLCVLQGCRGYRLHSKMHLKMQKTKKKLVILAKIKFFFCQICNRKTLFRSFATTHRFRVTAIWNRFLKRSLSCWPLISVIRVSSFWKYFFRKDQKISHSFANLSLLISSVLAKVPAIKSKIPSIFQNYSNLTPSL